MVWKLMKDRRTWLLTGAAVMLGVLHWSGLGSYLSLDALKQHRAALSIFVQHNFILAAAGYVLAYAAAVAFSFPGAVFLTLSGGLLFGAVIGTLLTVTGATIGAMLIFLFAKTLFGENALDRFGVPAQKLADGIRRNAASYLLVLRLVPLFPFFMVNLVPAFVGVPLLTYAVTTFLGIIPGTAVFSLAGSGLGSVLDQGGSITPASILTPQIIAGLIGLAALTLAAIPIQKRLQPRNS